MPCSPCATIHSAPLFLWIVIGGLSGCSYMYPWRHHLLTRLLTCVGLLRMLLYILTGSIFCGALTAWRRGIWLLGHALLSCHCSLDGPHYIAFYWLLSTHVMTIHATSSYLSHFSPSLEMPLLRGRCVTAVSSGLFSSHFCERIYSHWQ